MPFEKRPDRFKEEQSPRAYDADKIKKAQDMMQLQRSPCYVSLDKQSNRDCAMYSFDKRDIKALQRRLNK